jgi:hypothetical protein
MDAPQAVSKQTARNEMGVRDNSKAEAALAMASWTAAVSILPLPPFITSAPVAVDVIAPDNDGIFHNEKTTYSHRHFTSQIIPIIISFD